MAPTVSPNATECRERTGLDGLSPSSVVTWWVEPRALEQKGQDGSVART